MISEIGHKITTNFSNLQDFKQNNLVCARTSVNFCVKSCSLHESANVNSEGTRLRGVPKLQQIFDIRKSLYNFIQKRTPEGAL